MFFRTRRDYAHNLLLLPVRDRWRDLEDNPLALEVLGVRKAPKRLDIAQMIRKFSLRASPAAISPPRGPVDTNLQQLRELLKLNDLDIALLQLGLAISDSRALRDIAVSGTRQISFTSFARILGTVIGYETGEVAQHVGPKGRLVRCGLIASAALGDLEDRLRPKDGLLDLLIEPGLTRDRLLEEFLPNVAAGDAAWLDHRHLDREIALARALLSAALEQRATGVNLLLYGDTGSGKTELAKAIARDLGVPLYAARGSDDTGLTTAGERISSLLLGLRIVETGGAMVLFDELEDLYDRSFASVAYRKIGTVTAKDTFNRLFEDNPAPVIWTTNHVRDVDRAFLRRFTYSIEVRPGGIRQRERVLKHNHSLPPDQPDPTLDRIAERYDVCPAQAANAVRAARLIGDSSGEQLGRLLEGTCQLVSGRRVRASAEEQGTYVIDALNASIDLRALSERLATWETGSAGGITLCLYGPPGTGKTAYVRYLARQLGRRVLVRRPSDILDCYVGGTEQRIAQAFEDALVDDAILVFDEVDSLLRDRGDAERSWEVTQVNEFLQQLEAFRGICACTTNRWEGLDPAVMRRFTFKIELGVPSVDQAERLFWATFGAALPDHRPDDDRVIREALGRLAPTPGDFSAVNRRVVALRRSAPSVQELLDELDVETRHRRKAKPGFVGNCVA